MSLKKKLGMGVASAALGISLIAGGTFAFFSDTETSTNTFAAGKLDLAVNPSTIVEIENLKPGDVVYRDFLLENNGTLDISKVDLTTEVDNEEFAKHIKVLFLENGDKTGWTPIAGWDYNDVISQTTLYDLQVMTPDAVKNINKWWTWFKGEDSGLIAGTDDQMYVAFEFVDQGDQNHLQEAELELKWTFTAHQTPGEAKY